MRASIIFLVVLVFGFLLGHYISPDGIGAVVGAVIGGIAGFATALMHQLEKECEEK